MEVCVGSIVYSKCGRDKGLAFIVCGMESNFVFLVDGNIRPLEKPKKKKRMHIQPTNNVDAEFAEKLGKKVYINNADVRNILKPFVKP